MSINNFQFRLKAFILLTIFLLIEGFFYYYSHKLANFCFVELTFTNNCKNNYKFAMASKRAIDRVILKLINAYEYGIYSDVEADDFKKPAEQYRTEEQAKEFDNLIKHKAFDGKRNKVKDEIRKDSNQTNYQRVLNKMKSTIQNFENIEAEEINQDLDNQLKGKL